MAWNDSADIGQIQPANVVGQFAQGQKTGMELQDLAQQQTLRNALMSNTVVDPETGKVDQIKTLANFQQNNPLYAGRAANILRNQEADVGQVEAKRGLAEAQTRGANVDNFTKLALNTGEFANAITNEQQKDLDKLGPNASPDEIKAVNDKWQPFHEQLAKQNNAILGTTPAKDKVYGPADTASYADAANMKLWMYNMEHAETKFNPANGTYDTTVPGRGLVKSVKTDGTVALDKHALDYPQVSAGRLPPETLKSLGIPQGVGDANVVATPYQEGGAQPQVQQPTQRVTQPVKENVSSMPALGTAEQIKEREATATQERKTTEKEIEESTQRTQNVNDEIKPKLVKLKARFDQLPDSLKGVSWATIPGKLIGSKEGVGLVGGKTPNELVDLYVKTGLITQKDADNFQNAKILADQIATARAKNQNNRAGIGLTTQSINIKGLGPDQGKDSFDTNYKLLTEENKKMTDYHDFLTTVAKNSDGRATGALAAWTQSKNTGDWKKDDDLRKVAGLPPLEKQQTQTASATSATPRATTTYQEGQPAYRRDGSVGAVYTNGKWVLK